MTSQAQGRVYLGNAFSLSMVDVQDKPVTVELRRVGLDEVKAILSSGFVSAVGHPSTASALSKILGMEVPANRVSIQLQPGDTLVVFRVVSPHGLIGFKPQSVSRVFSPGREATVSAQEPSPVGA